ncbi:hypothetical protein SDC9_182851 [bioreactor metagenome]|uniref:Uncharacterized protein n=1 Tax=bioreactor metagenome TaxID=1076179 RepID=A0A645HI55_9ZZZZ
MVLLPDGQRAAAHVHVDDLRGTRLQRHQRERAGVGEQVEHLERTRVLSACRDVLAHPLPPGRHVEEQAVVLAAQHMHQIARAGLAHHMRLGHAAAHQFGAALAAHQPDLQHPVQRLARCDLRPARRKRIADGSDGRVVQFGKTGQHQHGRIGVERQVLAALVHAAPAVEDARGVGGAAHVRDGVEQGLHAMNGWKSKGE